MYMNKYSTEYYIAQLSRSISSFILPNMYLHATLSDFLLLNFLKNFNNCQYMLCNNFFFPSVVFIDKSQGTKLMPGP